MRIIDKIGVPSVIKFIKEQLEDYHTTKLGSVYLRGVKLNNKDSLKFNATWGMCYHSDLRKENKDKYFIRCSVNINENVYPLKSKHWIWVPDKKAANGKRSKRAIWYYDSIEEAAVYILSHEIFHYLSWTKQLVDRHGKLIRNCEANANWFAHGMVAKFGMPLEIKG